MTIPCRVCSANTDANLCWACTSEIQQVLAELPADLEDLQRAATRQVSAPAGLGDPRRQWNEPAGAPVLGRDGTPLPAYLRSTYGQTALPNTPWPYATGPADQLWAARNTITTWARHLLESRGIDAPDALVSSRQSGPVCEPHRHNRGRVEGDQCPVDCARSRCEHASCAEIRRPLAPREAWNVPRWLLGQLEAIRLDEAAAQIHEELLAMRDDNALWTIGQSVADLYAGTCDAPDVRVVVVDGLLTPTVGVCGVHMYVHEDDATVKCHACGAVYPMDDRREALLDRLDDQLDNVRHVADGLRRMGLDVTVDKIDGWLRRGTITDHGQDAAGHRLVRVGEVRAHAEILADKAAARRKITAA